MKELSRRNFLKGAGLSAAALAAAGSVGALTGCSPQSAANSTSTGGDTDTSQPSYMNRPAVGEPTETVQADFIVCGAGGCGMAATLQADDLGLNVILLEKKPTAGGTFAFAGVCFAPNSSYAIQDGKAVDYNDLIKTIMVYNHYIPSYVLLKNYMDEIPATIDWAMNIGAQFSYMAGGGPFRGLSLSYAGDRGSNGTLGGAAFIKVLIDEAERRNLDIRYSTAAQELVQDASGKVTGVLATDSSGKVIKFEAPFVLLCTGGWGNNPDFLRDLGRVDPDRVFSPGYDGRDGDGVYMARKAGTAWARGDGTIMFYGPHLPGSDWGQNLMNGVYQPVLWVDQNGKRFMNEGAGNFAETGSAIRDIKRMIVIQSQADIDRFTANGGMPFDNGSGGSGALDNYKDLLQQQIDAGNDRIFVADTIEALATAAGLDETNFKATIDRYNEIVDAGADDDFQKDPRYLTPLEEGPFYAFECNDGFFTTVGGVRINEDIQAVDDNGDVIEGLYVAGCDTGALCGDVYDFTSAPGEQSSWALTSGRLVAKHVADALGK